MNQDVINRVREMRDHHKLNLERLRWLAEHDVRIEGFAPDRQTMADRIKQEQDAIDNLTTAIDRMEAAPGNG